MYENIHFIDIYLRIVRKAIPDSDDFIHHKLLCCHQSLLQEKSSETVCVCVHECVVYLLVWTFSYNC